MAPAFGAPGGPPSAPAFGAPGGPPSAPASAFGQAAAASASFAVPTGFHNFEGTVAPAIGTRPVFEISTAASGGAFGAASPAGSLAFGAPSISPSGASGGAFGHSVPSPSAFGVKPTFGAPSASAFGQAAAAPAFGAPPSIVPSIPGPSNSIASVFGATAPAYGTTSTFPGVALSSTAVSAPSLFGTPQQAMAPGDVVLPTGFSPFDRLPAAAAAGTRSVPYQKTHEKETCGSTVSLFTVRTKGSSAYSPCTFELHHRLRLK